LTDDNTGRAARPGRTGPPRAPPPAPRPLHPLFALPASPALDLPVTAPASNAAPALADDADSSALGSLFQAQAKIYPRAVHGWYARWRWTLVWLTQLVFYGLPWLSWNDRPAVLFDLEARRFFVFGLVLVPQDLVYLAALLVIAALGLFFFTAVAGRLWCGYACPQTVYTEIFLWVERRLEGDRTARMRLDQGPWTGAKLARKGGKQAVWLAFSAVTGFTFVSYFTPARTLAGEAGSLGFSAWEWFWVLFYGLATYGNAGFLREQVCKYMCPYARFQSTLLDKDSMVIAYDTRRGDPRGSRSRKADPAALNLGSCIDCTLCVQVCPTGIDIRNGLQNECIGCAACIDVCDDVMDKMNYPRGLIRYATENGVAQGLSRAQMQRRVLRPRVLAYGSLLAVAAGSFVWSLASRPPLMLDVLKDRSSLSRTGDDGRIENVYTLQLANRSERALRLQITAEGLPGLAVTEPRVVDLPATGNTQLPMHLALPQASTPGLQGRSHPIRWLVREAGPGAASGTTGQTAAAASGAAPAPATSPVLLTEKSTFYVPG